MQTAFLLILVLFLVPLGTHVAWWAARDDLAASWNRADWTSAKILPEASAHEPAMVRIYAARTGRWKGAFAHHSWIVVKPEGALRYTRYDKVGWGSPVQLVVAVDGEAAQAMIPRIRKAVAEYPYRNGGDYRVWPGPNSNTFVAHVVTEVPDLHVAMPPTALGKDFHPWGDVASFTPSRTGLQLQLGGLLGVTVGWVEGIELNFLGLVTGIDLRRPALKLPGWGRIGVPIEQAA